MEVIHQKYLTQGKGHFLEQQHIHQHKNNKNLSDDYLNNSVSVEELSADSCPAEI